MGNILQNALKQRKAVCGIGLHPGLFRPRFVFARFVFGRFSKAAAQESEGGRVIPG